MAGEPFADDVGGSQVELDGVYGNLPTGRWLIVSGERSDLGNVTGVNDSELVMLAGVTQTVDLEVGGDTPHTVLQFAQPLSFTYRRETVTIYGNVVKATHGATSSGEVLGSGDASQRFQTFALKQSPLTYLAAPTARGAEAALEVRVNEVLWREAPDLLSLGPRDRGYIVRQDEEGATSIFTGDGVHGARALTGTENVRATYRTGIGAAGNLKSGSFRSRWTGRSA